MEKTAPKCCYNCKHHIPTSEEAIFCDLRKIFHWQDYEGCTDHEPETKKGTADNA